MAKTKIGQPRGSAFQHRLETLLRRSILMLVVLAAFQVIGAQPACAEYVARVVCWWTEDGVSESNTYDHGSTQSIRCDKGTDVTVRVIKETGAPTSVTFYCYDQTNGNYPEETSTASWATFSDAAGPLDTQLMAFINTLSDVVRINVDWIDLPDPDLVVTNVRVDDDTTPTQFDVGDTVRLSCWVGNDGSSSAGSSYVGYYIGTSRTDISDFIDDDYVPPLDPNDYSYEYEDYTFVPADAGTRYFVLKADCDRDVDEGDGEGNNISYIGPFTVVDRNDPPRQPSNPVPSNGATGVSLTTGLNWSCSDPDGDTLYYTVYFEKGDSSPDNIVRSNFTGSSLSNGYLATLEYETTYYWKVVADDRTNTPVAGPVWSFTTLARAPTNPEFTAIKVDGQEVHHGSIINVPADTSGGGFFLLEVSVENEDGAPSPPGYSNISASIREFTSTSDKSLFTLLVQQAGISFDTYLGTDSGGGPDGYYDFVLAEFQDTDGWATNVTNSVCLKIDTPSPGTYTLYLRAAMGNQESWQEGFTYAPAANEPGELDCTGLNAKKIIVNVGDTDYSRMNVPYYWQSNTMWCGLASVAMVANYYGSRIKPWQVADEMGKAAMSTTNLPEMAQYLANKLGVATELWTYRPPENFFLRRNIEHCVSEGRPLIIADYDPDPNGVGHAVVVTGCDSVSVFINDPSGVLTHTAGPCAMLWSDFFAAVNETWGWPDVEGLSIEDSELTRSPQSLPIDLAPEEGVHFSSPDITSDASINLRWDGDSYDGFYYGLSNSWETSWDYLLSAFPPDASFGHWIPNGSSMTVRPSVANTTDTARSCITRVSLLDPSNTITLWQSETSENILNFQQFRAANGSNTAGTQDPGSLQHRLTGLQPGPYVLRLESIEGTQTSDTTELRFNLWGETELHRDVLVTDTSRTPHTSDPGQPKVVFHPGETVRMTLRASNTGFDVEPEVVLDVAPSADHNNYTTPPNSTADSPLAKDETDYYSFDYLIPSDGSMPNGTYDILAAMRDANEFDVIYDETNAGSNTTTFGAQAWITNVFTVVPVEYTLTIHYDDSQGSVEVGGTPRPDGWSHQYESGETVQLEAQPDTGHEFDGWSGGLLGDTSPTSITMSGNKDVTAGFAVIKYRLSVEGSHGKVKVNNGVSESLPYSGSFDYDSSVQLEVEPDPGYHFDKWLGDLAGSDNPESITMSGVRTVTAVIVLDENHPPDPAPTVTITPANPTSWQSFRADASGSDDSDGDLVTYGYEWYKDGVLQPDRKWPTVTARWTKPGETWRCVATPTDGKDDGPSGENSVNVNGPPVPAPTVTITPSKPTTRQSLRCAASGSDDPDGDPFIYKYQWYKDGVLQPLRKWPTVTAKWTQPGETWKCVVTPTDGRNDGPTGENSVTINSPPPAPTTVTITPSNPTSRQSFRCSASGSIDPDGDPVIYKYQWYKDGLLQPLRKWPTVTAKWTQPGETWRCVVTPTDGRDSGPTGEASVVVGGKGTAGPVVLSSLTVLPTAIGAEMTFTLSADASVTCEVLNIAGRSVRTVVTDRQTPSGMATFVWDGRNVTGCAAPSGTYLVRVTAAGQDGSVSRGITALTVRR